MEITGEVVEQVIQGNIIQRTIIGNIIGAVSFGSGDMLKSVYDPQEILGDAFDRENMTGTQLANTISDLDTAIAQNSAVVLNTAKRSYPVADEQKLDGIEANANNYTLEVHGDDKHSETYLKVESDPVFGASEASNFEAGDKSKLDGIAEGAEVNVQSDWNATEGDALILNKPTIPTNTDEKVKYDSEDPTAGYLSNKISSGDGIEITEGTEETENMLIITNTNPTPYSLPTATDSVLGGIKVGSRLTITDGVLSADLIPDAVSSVNTKTGAVVLDSDDISDTEKTHKFTTAEDILRLSGVEAGAEVNNISDTDATNLTDGGATTLHKHSYNNLDDLPSLFSGAYGDLSGLPTIPANLGDLGGDLDDIADGDTYVKSENNLTDTLKGYYDGAYSHSGVITGNPHAVTKTDVGLSNVPNLDFSNASNITSGTLSSSVLPPVALTTVSVVDDEAEQLALTAEEGDVAVRTDLNKTYMKNNGEAGTMADWTELQTPTDSVLSVNGKTGTVSLSQDDVGDGATYVRTHNDYTDTDLSKLGGIELGAEVNNISDVNATDLTDGGETSLHTHSYNNLNDLPSLFSGSYNDLSDTPTIPTALSDLSDDATHRLVTDTEKSTWNSKSDFDGAYSSLSGIPSTFAPASHGNEAHSSTYITAGDIPAIPSALSDLSDDSTHRLVTDTEKSTWNAKQDALVADTDYLTPSTAGSTYEPIKGENDNYVTDADITKIGYISVTGAVNLDNATLQGNTFNGASQLVQTGADGKLPAIDGSQLTNLPSGTSTFIGATDTPASYEDYAGYIPQVNASEDALEWKLLQEPVTGTFDDTDLSSGILTISHSYGSAIMPYMVVDNNNKAVIPDDITFASNSITMDFSSQGTITGTWSYSIGGTGFATNPAGGISNIVEDTTPQLGGDLDMNSQNIIAGALTISPTEVGYLDGVSSNIQTQLGNKQATLVSGTNIKTINSTSLLGSGNIAITGVTDEISNVVEDTTPQLGGNLDMNSNSINAGGTLISETELGYLNNVSSNIQTQINACVKDTGNETIAGIKTFSSFPITPSSAPTTDYQVANKKYVDDNAGGTALIASYTFTNSTTNSYTFSSLGGLDSCKVVFKLNGTGSSNVLLQFNGEDIPAYEDVGGSSGTDGVKIGNVNDGLYSNANYENGVIGSGLVASAGVQYDASNTFYWFGYTGSSLDMEASTLNQRAGFLDTNASSEGISSLTFLTETSSVYFLEGSTIEIWSN